MSKNVALFVDVANLYYSARGQDVDVDYVALLKTATKGRDLIRAYAYSGLDPENENQRKFIDFLKKNGYMVLTKDIRKFGDGRVKANLDIELVVDLFRLADRMDIAVIVSGDGDFAPAIKALQDKGVRCEVISFRPNTSSDLIAVADEFIDIMKIAGIGRGSKEAKAQRGMSAPEMPAKEVVPEFGFREASPSVAQAALSALREGRGDGARSVGSARGRGRGRSAERPAAATAPSEPEAVPAAALAEDGETPEGELRKRRRRRGGRGRGRSRGRAAESTAAVESTGAGEIGWVELDDLSQLAELEGVEDLGVEDLGVDREYSFEEADAATLAELGLPSDAAVAAPQAADRESEAEPEAETKRSTRRRSTKKQVGAVTDTTPAHGETAGAAAPATGEKKPARRRTTKKAAGGAAEASSAATVGDATSDAAVEKPKRTRASSVTRGGSTSRSRSPRTTQAENEAETKDRPRRRTSTTKRIAAGSSTEDGGAEGEPAEDTEGIWQRFRSARGRTPSS